MPLPGQTGVPQPGATGQPGGTGASPFGVMLPPQVGNSSQGMDVAKGLGVTYLRPSQAVFIDQWNGSCAPCDLAAQAGLQLVLTVRNGGGGVAPSSPPGDLEAYKKTLGEILDKYRPAVIAVENEENSNLFYTGTPQEYGAELQAACDVAHARGIKCMNGGLVSALAALLAWDHYVESGDTARASDFAARAFDASQQRLLNSAQARTQIAKGKQLLDADKAAGADYLNFHWYIGDVAALDETVAYLKGVSGLAVASNETGQTDDDPARTAAVMQEMVKLQVPIVVWYGLDGPKARGLMEANGTLRSTGQAFRDFIQQNFK